MKFHEAALNSPLIIFDLDGTLVDTAVDIVDSLNFAIAKHQLAPVTYSDLHNIVGQGGRVAIKRAFALRNQPINDDELEVLYDAFIQYYLDKIPGKSQPYPGVIEALDALKAAGYALAVCTNKTEALAKPLLDRLNLTGYFSAITCADTFPWRKPDPRHITSTIELAKGNPARSIMVGDSINDIAAAINAGVPSIGVTFGYTDVPMAELEPTVVVSHFSEITPDLADKLLANTQ
jgi:phosphoglycolate phosphatase